MRLVDGHLARERRVHGQRVRGDHRHPHAGRRDLQVRDAEDLAGLVADLELLARTSRRPCSEPAHGTTLSASGAGNGESRRTARPRQRLAHVAGARRRAGLPATAASSAYSRSMPAWPAPDAAWYEATTSSVSPNSRCSAPSAAIMDSVVQLGLAMMPFGRSVDLSGVDLRHHQRHLGVHPERAGVVDRDRAAGGRDRRPLGARSRPARRTSRCRRRRRPRARAPGRSAPRRARSASCRPSAPRRSAGSRPTARSPGR